MLIHLSSKIEQDLPRYQAVFPTESISDGPQHKGIHPFQGAALGYTTPHPRKFLKIAWILQDTWSLIDQCAAGRRYPNREQLQLCHIDQRIRENLMADQARRETVVGGALRP